MDHARLKKLHSFITIRFMYFKIRLAVRQHEFHFFPINFLPKNYLTATYRKTVSEFLQIWYYKQYFLYLRHRVSSSEFINFISLLMHLILLFIVLSRCDT